jgi:alkanesulfonate monooxygenase SsuD/methylene tetrahydromethanopterin reductase-like flavin-dependent oxidoreductase (luciferase family)
MQLGLSPTQSRGDFKVMQRQAQLAESVGFSTVWAHEHHSAGMMYPDPIMALAAVASVTRSISLGTNMLLLPIHHPVRVAQAGAMLDVLSEGRFTLGVANGYSVTDLRTFGIDRGQRGQRLTEGIELIRALWSGEAVTREGRDFALDQFELYPLPAQRRAPPVVIGGHAEVAIRRAARLGDGYLISTTASRASLPALIATYREALAVEGKVFDGVLLNRLVCAVGSRRERDSAREFYATALLKLYDSWGHGNITGLGTEQRSTDAIAAEYLVVGEPAECLDQLRQYASLGIGHVACLTSFGGPPDAWVDNSTRLLGEQVLPQLREVPPG